jgi:hypothetical protein
MCHGEKKQKFSAKPNKNRHANAIPYKRREKYKDDYEKEYQ